MEAATHIEQTSSVLVSPRPRLHFCKYCGKNWDSLFDKEKHERIHTGEKPFVCDVPECGKMFSDRSNFRRHQIAIHNPQKSYTCDFPDCGKSFTHNFNLKKHVSFHTKMMENTCTECKKQFKSKAHMVNHLRMSHGIVRSKSKPNQQSAEQDSDLPELADISQEMSFDERSENEPPSKKIRVQSPEDLTRQPSLKISFKFSGEKNGATARFSNSQNESGAVAAVSNEVPTITTPTVTREPTAIALLSSYGKSLEKVNPVQGSVNTAMSQAPERPAMEQSVEQQSFSPSRLQTTSPEVTATQALRVQDPHSSPAKTTQRLSISEISQLRASSRPVPAIRTSLLSSRRNHNTYTPTRALIDPLKPFDASNISPPNVTPVTHIPVANTSPITPPVTLTAPPPPSIPLTGPFMSTPIFSPLIATMPIVSELSTSAPPILARVQQTSARAAIVPMIAPFGGSNSPFLTASALQKPPEDSVTSVPMEKESTTSLSTGSSMSADSSVVSKRYKPRGRLKGSKVTKWGVIPPGGAPKRHRKSAVKSKEEGTTTLEESSVVSIELSSPLGATGISHIEMRTGKVVEQDSPMEVEPPAIAESQFLNLGPTLENPRAIASLKSETTFQISNGPKVVRNIVAPAVLTSAPASFETVKQDKNTSIPIQQRAMAIGDVSGFLESEDSDDEFTVVPIGNCIFTLAPATIRQSFIPVFV